MKYDLYVEFVNTSNAFFDKVPVLKHLTSVLNEEQFNATTKPKFSLLFINSSYASVVAEVLDVDKIAFDRDVNGRGISCYLEDDLAPYIDYMNDSVVVASLTKSFEKAAIDRVYINRDALFVNENVLVRENRGRINAFFGDFKRTIKTIPAPTLPELMLLVEQWDSLYSACVTRDAALMNAILSPPVAVVPCVVALATSSIAAIANLSSALNTMYELSKGLPENKESTSPTRNRCASL